MAAFKFTADQIAKIKGLYEAGPIDGNYSHIYQYIAGILPPCASEQRWFEGAAQANAGQGVFSVFIREYSKLQMKLRGVEYSESLMQNASNQVAINAFDDILGKNPNTADNRAPQPDGSVTAPTIKEIALNDALGVGKTLFFSIPSDSAIKDDQNSGWSGVLLFTGLGSDQSWRLFGSSQTDAKFDILDDLRNFLFARHAFEQAFKAARAEFLAEIPSSIINQLKLAPIYTSDDPQYLKALKAGQVFIDLGISIQAALNIDLSNAVNSNSLFSSFFPSASVARSTALALTAIDDANLLDMLRRSVYGNSINKTLTEDDFQTNALALFSQMGNNQLYELTMDLGDLAEKSKNDFTALVALNAASIFQFAGQDALECLQNSNSDLYIKWQQDQLAPKAGELGTQNFSAQWREDRAKLIEALRDGSNAHSGSSSQLSIEDRNLQQSFLLTPDGYFADPSGSNSAVLGTDQILFGSNTANDAFTASAGDDHLYGGDGNDTLNGGSGDDYLEGNNGDDKLLGSAGQDTVLGGAGDDILNGGVGNDSLKGGAGNDSYIFTTGDGQDLIIDSDGQGQIIVNGKPITGGKAIVGEGRAWESDDKAVRFTLIDHADNTKDLWISYGDENKRDSITVRNYTAGALGIMLGDADVVPTPPDPQFGDLTLLAGTKVTKTINGAQVSVTEYQGGDTASLVIAGAGDNEITLGNGNNNITGGPDNNFVLVGSGNNQIAGGSQDYIVAGSGDNVITGQGGKDIFLLGGGHNRVYANSEVDLSSAIAQAKAATATGGNGDFFAVGVAPIKSDTLRLIGHG